MNYKDSLKQIQNLFPGFYIIEEFNCYKHNKNFTYTQKEWIDKIIFFLNEINQKKYTVIYQIYEYIYPFPSQIPYQLLIDSNFLNILISYFNNLVSNLCANQTILEIKLIPENEMQIIKNHNLLLCIFIFSKLLQTDYLLQKSLFDCQFFVSISKLCFNRNKFCKISELNNNYFSICIESLKLVQQIFELSPEIVLEFEELFEFTYHLRSQYIMARVIEIKYFSLRLFLPWMSISPGNKRVFELFCSEMKKSIESSEYKIFDVQTIKNHYSNTKKIQSNKLNNQILIISLLLEGILRFIESLNIDEMTLKETFYDILYFSNYGIRTNHELTILNGLKIFNFFLANQKISENDIISFISEIQYKMSILLNTSKDVCREEMEMLKYLFSLVPRTEKILFEEQFITYFCDVLRTKEFEWKKNLIVFIGDLLNNLNFTLITEFLNYVNVASILSDINAVADDEIIKKMLDGVSRVMMNSKEGKDILLKQGIEDSFSEYIENPTFSDAIQFLLDNI